MRRVSASALDAGFAVWRFRATSARIWPTHVISADLTHGICQNALGGQAVSGVGRSRGDLLAPWLPRVDVPVEELRQEEGPHRRTGGRLRGHSVRNATLRPEIEQFKSKLPDEALVRSHANRFRIWKRRSVNRQNLPDPDVAIRTPCSWYHHCCIAVTVRSHSSQGVRA